MEVMCIFLLPACRLAGNSIQFLNAPLHTHIWEGAFNPYYVQGLGNKMQPDKRPDLKLLVGIQKEHDAIVNLLSFTFTRSWQKGAPFCKFGKNLFVIFCVAIYRTGSWRRATTRATAHDRCGELLCGCWRTAWPSACLPATSRKATQSSSTLTRTGRLAFLTARRNSYQKSRTLQPVSPKRDSPPYQLHFPPIAPALDSGVGRVNRSRAVRLLETFVPLQAGFTAHECPFCSPLGVANSEYSGGLFYSARTLVNVSAVD